MRRVFLDRLEAPPPPSRPPGHGDWRARRHRAARGVVLRARRDGPRELRGTGRPELPIARASAVCCTSGDPVTAMPISLFPRSLRGSRTGQASHTGRPRLVEQEPCRVCASANVHRSRARNVFERLRKMHTALRPFQCHDCGWRGWLLPLQFASQGSTRSSDPSLASLDPQLDPEPTTGTPPPPGHDPA